MPIKLQSEIGSNFCYAPWTNIHINTTGRYKTCCAGTDEIGDLRVIPIKNLLTNKELAGIKKSLYQNQSHLNCSICTRQEQHSSVSERTWYNNIAEFQSIQIADINSQNLQNLDIRWSNTCNLSCVYCDHEASSQWAMLKKQPVERLDYTNTLSSILELIDENKSTIKNLALLGGEPLLQKENDALLDVIADHVHINVITNLSVPLENNRVFQKLLAKKNVMWDISFETVEDQFEYVRRGSSWQTMIKNIKYLRDCTKDKNNHNIGITSQYSIYNAMHLSKLHEYFVNHNLPMMRWNELHHPNILSVSSLPRKYLNKAIQELEMSKQYHFMPVQERFLSEISKSLQSIKNTKDNCDDLYQWHHEQESQYWPETKLKFEELWPEFK
jgi:organic radical activating enzyme